MYSHEMFTKIFRVNKFILVTNILIRPPAEFTQ